MGEIEETGQQEELKGGNQEMFLVERGEGKTKLMQRGRKCPFFSSFFFWEGSKKLHVPAVDKECVRWPPGASAQPWILPVSLGMSKKAHSGK